MNLWQTLLVVFLFTLWVWAWIATFVDVSRRSDLSGRGEGRMGGAGGRRMAIIVPEIGARLPRCCSPSPVGYENVLKKYSTRTIVMVIPRIAVRIDMVRAGTIVRRCPSWCFTCLAMP